MIVFNALEKVILLKRYKRFLCDVRREDGSIVTVHCPNSGSMKTCYEDGDIAYIQQKEKPLKLTHGLEMILRDKNLVVVNTQLANKIVYNSLTQGCLRKKYPFKEVYREKKYGKSSRIDILGIDENNHKTYIEVKSVSMINEKSQYSFPDAVTLRGQKHLEELVGVVQEGHKAVMLFLVMREGGRGFVSATEIDPKYTEKLHWSSENGVEVVVYSTSISLDKVEINSEVPWIKEG